MAIMRYLLIRFCVRNAGDSGRVAGGASHSIEYAGTPLLANAVFTWTATWWGSNSGQSATSIGEFDMGPLEDNDWHDAQWLSALNHTVSQDRSVERAQFRTDFKLPSDVGVAWARAHVAAPGCHHLEINGRVPSLDRMGVCVFREPNMTVLWQTHDITALIHPGPNAIGLLAGHVLQSHPAFSHTPPRLRAVLVIHLDDNTTVTVGTTDKWQSRHSYVTRDSLYTGTTVDWTQVESGWSRAGFQLTPAWVTTSWVARSPGGSLRLEAVPAAAALGVVKPTAVLQLPNGDFLYSFPTNFVGVIRVAPLPSAPDGATLTITHGEFLTGSVPGPVPPAPPVPKIIPDGHFVNADGMGLWFKLGGTRHHVTQLHECGVNLFAPRPWGFRLSDARMRTIVASTVDFNCSMCNNSCFAANKPTITSGYVEPRQATPSPGLGNTFSQVDTHVLRHGNTAPLTPLFTWHGFQFMTVKAAGFTFSGALDAIEAIELRTNLTSRGDLEFGGDSVASEHDAALLNAINFMTINSQKSNVAQGMPTDCPTRERKGWLGDALDASDEALYNVDMSAVYENFVSQMSDDQGQNGNIPIYVPNDGQCKGTGGNNCSGCPPPYNPHFGTTGCSDIGWTLAFPAIIEALYNHTGDMRLMRRQYANLQRYTDNLVAVAKTRPYAVADCDRWGDWLPPTQCNMKDGAACPVFSLIAGFSYVKGLDIMSRIAHAIGHASDGARYHELADTARTGYHARFFDNSILAYGSNTSQKSFQTLNVPGLVIDSIPSSVRPAVVAGLAHDIENRAFHLGTGAVTSKYHLRNINIRT
jgi:hypothetical protein